MNDAEERAGLEDRIAALERELATLAMELAEIRMLAHASAPAQHAPPPEPAAPPPVVEPSPAPPLVAPSERPAVLQPRRRTLGQLAEDWDLVGARGFAIAGGAVTALGIGFFFVLAANRGWIDEGTRIALGALASALAVGAGVLLRARYGQYISALAAVGAGIAGAYATLAAAAVRYDLVPDPLALPLAGAIAAVATVIALRWSSQLLAAIGLLGAALAPALQALDTELGWASAAFALIVLVAAGLVSPPRSWTYLLVATAVLVGAQIEWLVAAADVRADVGTIVVAGAFLFTLLGISVASQVASGRRALEQIALSFGLAASGATFLVTFQLFQDQTNRGLALVLAGALWALVFAGLRVWRFLDLSLVVGVAALALTAAGTADLLSDAALTIAWAAEATLLALIGWRLRDVRLQILSVGYATLSAWHALVFEARPDLFFQEDADHLRAVLPLAAAGVAFAVAAVLAPERYAARTESGLLGFVRELRLGLEQHRRGVRESLGFVAAALVTLAAAFALVSASFAAGHIAASFLAAAVGAVILGVAGRLRSDRLAFAAYCWLGVVLAESALFDLPDVSHGGWSVIAAGSGLLVGAYAHRVPSTQSGARDAVAAGASALAALALGLGVTEVTGRPLTTGLALLVCAATYVLLAGAVFRRPPLRDFTTALWLIGMLFVLAAEAVILASWSGTLFAAALTGAALCLLAHPLAEQRLWEAGGASIALATFATLLSVTPPSHLFESSDTPARALWVLAGCIVGLAIVAVTAYGAEYRMRVGAVAGALVVYALSLAILGLAERLSGASIQTDFERGHTAVSALWAIVGLGLLVAGLLRGSAALRYGGLALFGLTLAKIFLYDLAALSSLARAFSFVLVGAFILAGGFFLQRLSDRIGPGAS